MKKLPKEMIGLQFDKLFYIEMNNFDVEMLLPALFWLVRSGGRDRAGQRSAQIEVTDRIVSLAGHPKVKNFNDSEGIPLLDKWVRSSLATIGRSGQGGKGKEQIAYLHPLTFLTYKPHLPTESSRMRKAHHFIYHLCLNYVDRKIALGSDKKDFNASIRDTFNKGVRLSEGQDQEGHYDGTTVDLDLETLLQLHYLDGFFASKKSSQERKATPEPVCFQAASSIASDFSSFIEVYAGHVPSEALSRYLVCLLNFELFIYTQRLTKAINQLVLHNTIPPELDQTSMERTPLNIYVDLTQIRGSRSDQLAHVCVNRDIEDLENYFRSSLTLRTLDRYVAGNSDMLNGQPKEGASYMVSLNGLRSKPDICSDARAELRKILKEYSADTDEVLPEEIQSLVNNTKLDDLSKVVEILASAQRKNGVGNIMKWFGDSGGMLRSDGILRGNTKGRRVWRYVMSDMLLETLVQLASISPEPRFWSKNTIPKTSKVAPDSITLSAFLRFLKERYGLLIDTPPNFDQSVEATAAAKENFAALKQRLRQMGLFLDLSDDFNAQRIFPRFRE